MDAQMSCLYSSSRV